MKKWDEPMDLPDVTMPETSVHTPAGKKEDIFERNARVAMEYEQVHHEQKGFIPLPEMSELIRQSESDYSRNEVQTENKRQEEKPFDLRKAIIYSEILRPKHKEY